MAGKRKLSAKEALFVGEYLVDLNASGACLRAGYKTGHPDVRASRIMARPHVQAAISEAMAERSKRTEITADWVMRNLKKVAKRCMQDVPVLDHEGKPIGEYRFDSSGANGSLKLIGTHLGMFKQVVEHSGTVDHIIKSMTPEQIKAELEALRNA